MFIVEDIIGSIFWGTLIAALITGIIFLLCMLASRKSIQSTESLLVLGGLFLFNAIACSFLVGAIYAKEYAEDICNFIGDMTDIGKDTVLSTADFNELKNQITEEYKSAKPLLDLVDANEAVRHMKVGNSIADYISDEINDTIDEHIKNCLLWMLGGIVTAITSIMLISRNQPDSRRRMNRKPRAMVVQRHPRVTTRRR